MRKLIYVLMSAMLVLTACGSNNTGGETSAATTVAIDTAETDTAVTDAAVAVGADTSTKTYVSADLGTETEIIYKDDILLKMIITAKTPLVDLGYTTKEEAEEGLKEQMALQEESGAKHYGEVTDEGYVETMEMDIAKIAEADPKFLKDGFEIDAANPSFKSLEEFLLGHGYVEKK